jgi:hypothetical protein
VLLAACKPTTYTHARMHAPVSLRNAHCAVFSDGWSEPVVSKTGLLSAPRGAPRSESKSHAGKSHYSMTIINCVVVQSASLELPVSAFSDFFYNLFLCCKTAWWLLTSIVPRAVRVIFISKYMRSHNMLTLYSFNGHLSLFICGLLIQLRVQNGTT